MGAVRFVRIPAQGFVIVVILLCDLSVVQLRLELRHVLGRKRLHVGKPAASVGIETAIGPHKDLAGLAPNVFDGHPLRLAFQF
ncbi:hypothetical protein D3C72_2423040 [compost metagenome]